MTAPETQVPEATAATLNIDDIPAMPGVAAQVMHLVAQENVRTDELANVIVADSAMTAKVLQIANSPFYGFSRKIDTVKDGVVLLGLSAVKGLIITIATRNIYKNPGLLENLLWQHSVGAAITANHLAKTLRCCDPDEAFIGGLMHDIGKTVINNMDHVKYVKFYQRVYNENLTDDGFTEVEERAFGFNHLTIGKLVAKKWNLSADLAHCITTHKNPDAETIASAPTPAMLATVTLANLVCHCLGIGIREPKDDTAPAESAAAKHLKLSEDRLDDLIDSAEAAYAEQKDAFSF